MTIPNLDELNDEETFYLFTLYNNKVVGFEKINFCGYEGVQYGGEIYTPLPVDISGLSTSSSGAEITPTLTIGDNQGVIGRLIATYQIEGAEVAIQRVKKRVLDNGATPNYLYKLPAEKFKVIAKLSQTINQISYKLKNRGGLKNQIPARILNNSCTWKSYRGKGCNYAGVPMFTVDNQPTTDPEQDVCALTRKACNLRSNFLNFSGVPTINNF